MKRWKDQRPTKQLLGGRYRLGRSLGRGGMAEVYLAWDEQKKREVAIKVMTPDGDDPRRSERFLREGETAVSLHHQHIIAVYDYGDCIPAKIDNNSGSASSNTLTVPYIVMEYIKGGDLREWLEKKWQEPGGTCSLDEILPIFEQVCHAVQYIHNEDMVHRDIKPANILFRKLPQKGGRVEVVLSDFGLVVADNATLTQPKAGTPLYMAPEHRQGAPQKASDIFSLGVVLYQLCTGHVPSLFQPPTKPTLLNPTLPAALDKVILRALSNQPSERFASASLFLRAVQKAARERPRSSVYLPSIHFPTVPLPPLSLPQIPPPPKPKPRPTIAVAFGIVMVLMIGIVWVNPDIIRAAPSATVTITPASATLQDTYQMQGVTSNANLDNHQVNVRKLTSTKTDTKQVSLAHSHQDGQSATGHITFSNSSSDSINILPGTTLQVGNIQIVTDEDADVPAATSKTVLAHTVQAGAAGNIPALAIYEVCCGTSSIFAKNQIAFTGGADAVDYNYLKPDDLKTVSNADQDTLKSNVQKDIKGQEKSGEQLLGDINCDSPQTTENIQPNTPVASSVTSAIVTISMSCRAEAFDANAVQTIVQNMFQRKVSINPGPEYTLAGHIVTHAQAPQVLQDGSIMFQVTVSGVCSYKWTDTNKQDLLKKIKGKSKAEAQAILNSYLGVDSAKIAINNGGTTLPNDENQITLDVNKVKGL